MLAQILDCTPKLDGALCVTIPGLHDGDDPARTQVAVALCRSCPALAHCRAWVDGMTRYQHRNLTGVWAGKIFNSKVKEGNMSQDKSYTDSLVPSEEEFPEFAGWLLAQSVSDLETLCNYYNMWVCQEEDDEDGAGKHKLFRIIMAIGEVAVAAMALRGRGDEYSEHLAVDNRAKLAARRDDQLAFKVARETHGMTLDIWRSLIPKAKRP